MSNKNFKIKPTTWSKEYTFEQFKMLNPGTPENILINYYNKYLFEYAEDRSKHINHFNDFKKVVSEEVKTLKNHWEFETYDKTVDTNGRPIILPHNKPHKNSLKFVRESAANNGQYALSTKASALKPEIFTISTWFKKDDYSASSLNTQNLLDNYITTNYGFELHLHAGNITFHFRSLKDDKGHSITPQYRALCTDNPARIYYDVTNGDGWFNVVVTMDGQYLKLYINGVLDISNTDYRVNGVPGAVYGRGIAELEGGSGHTVKYGNPDNQLMSVGGHLVNTNNAQGIYNGIISETAIWDTALDTETINTLYNGGVPKFDLNPNLYMVDDTRNGYSFYKPYIDNLIAWWRFEEGSGTTAKDSSPSGNDLILSLIPPTWSTSVPE